SASLAETGFARGLIVMENGNAFGVLYAVSADKPFELAYQDRFMKRGEYNASEYAVRLEDNGVRSGSVMAMSAATRGDVLTFKTAARQVVDGFLIRPGNDRTRRFDFTGTTWRSTSAPSVSYALQKDGIVVYRSRVATSFGNWRVTDGVLYMDINKFTF